MNNLIPVTAPWRAQVHPDRPVPCQDQMDTASDRDRTPLARRAGEARSRRHERFPPVVILGGGVNALELARSLAQYGPKVYAINVPDAYVRHCRLANWISMEGRPHLTDLDGVPAGAPLRLPPRRRGVGSQRPGNRDPRPAPRGPGGKVSFGRLRPSSAALYAEQAFDVPGGGGGRSAHAAVRVARNWEQIEELRPALLFPLLVKPELSHVFEARFGASSSSPTVMAI